MHKARWLIKIIICDNIILEDFGELIQNAIRDKIILLFLIGAVLNEKDGM